MTLYVIGGRMEDRDHAYYDDQTGHLDRREGLPSRDDVRGGFTELSPGDFWGAFRRHDDTKVFFRNDHMYPDDPERFLVFVDHLGPTQARVHYALDGKVVEQTVYKRVTELGVNPTDQYEEDWDNMLFFPKSMSPAGPNGLICSRTSIERGLYLGVSCTPARPDEKNMVMAALREKSIKTTTLTRLIRSKRRSIQ